MSKKNQILLFMIAACFSFSGCAQVEPCPKCPTITIPYYEKQVWEPLEVHYGRIRNDK